MGRPRHAARPERPRLHLPWGLLPATTCCCAICAAVRRPQVWILGWCSSFEQSDACMHVYMCVCSETASETAWNACLMEWLAMAKGESPGKGPEMAHCKDVEESTSRHLYPRTSAGYVSCTCIHTCIHTYIHTYMYACIHTYILCLSVSESMPNILCE